MHEDIWHTDAWIAQLEGSKKFLLYHPGSRKHLEYVASDGASEFVDPLRPDLIKFPNFKQAAAIEGHLEKGEQASPRGVPRTVAERVEIEGAVSDVRDFCLPPSLFLVAAGEILYIPRRWPHHAVGCSKSVSLTENFFTKCNKDVVIPKWEAYVQRRMKCAPR